MLLTDSVVAKLVDAIPEEDWSQVEIIGRLWLMANPASTLKSQWPYYIEPAEQTPEVQAQLDALIRERVASD